MVQDLGAVQLPQGVPQAVEVPLARGGNSEGPLAPGGKCFAAKAGPLLMGKRGPGPQEGNGAPSPMRECLSCLEEELRGSQPANGAGLRYAEVVALDVQEQQTVQRVCSKKITKEGSVLP